MTDEAGTVVAGRYELLDVLGQGSQGAVWRALDRNQERLVAVKMLTGTAVLDRRFVERLKREMGVMKVLEGTCAVAAFDLCSSPHGAPCLVMELLEGIDLEEHLRLREAAGERMPLAELVDLLSPVVAALEKAHAAGIVHRDLKPANVFLQRGESGTFVRLLDFGLARVRTAKPLTAVGTVIGSPAYMAPEVWKGIPDRIDARADVYSLTVLVFRALSGHVPFDAATLPAQHTLVTTAERPSLVAVRPDLPQAIDAWVARGLAVDAASRFSDVGVLWEALRLSATARRGIGFGLPKVPKPLMRAWRAARSAVSRMSQGADAPPGVGGAPPESSPPSEPRAERGAVTSSHPPAPGDGDAVPSAGLPHVPPPPPPPPPPADPDDDAKTLMRLPRVSTEGGQSATAQDARTQIAIPKSVVAAASSAARRTEAGRDDQTTRFDLPRVRVDTPDGAPPAPSEVPNTSARTATPPAAEPDSAFSAAEPKKRSSPRRARSGVKQGSTRSRTEKTTAATAKSKKKAVTKRKPKAATKKPKAPRNSADGTASGAKRAASKKKTKKSSSKRSSGRSS
jgi:serine/threonine-protein kinase